MMMISFGTKLAVGIGLVVMGTHSLAQTSTALTKDTLFSMDIATVIASIGAIGCFVYWVAKDRAGIDARLVKHDEAMLRLAEAMARQDRNMDRLEEAIKAVNRKATDDKHQDD
jgi:hypothetical protein